MCLLEIFRKAKKRKDGKRRKQPTLCESETVGNVNETIEISIASSPRFDRYDYRNLYDSRLNGDHRARIPSDKDQTRSSCDSGVCSATDKLTTDKRSNFIVKSHCDSDSDDSISHYGDAEADNWHGIDPTRRGRGATKKSSLQGKLHKRHNSLGCPKRNTSAERNQRKPHSRTSSMGRRSPSVRSGKSDEQDIRNQLVRSKHSSCKSARSVTTSDASEFRKSTRRTSRRPSMLNPLPYESINPELYN